MEGREPGCLGSAAAERTGINPTSGFVAEGGAGGRLSLAPPEGPLTAFWIMVFIMSLNPMTRVFIVPTGSEIIFWPMSAKKFLTPSKNDDIPEVMFCTTELTKLPIFEDMSFAMLTPEITFSENQEETLPARFEADSATPLAKLFMFQIQSLKVWSMKKLH
jgi:hypothetical protein